MRFIFFSLTWIACLLGACSPSDKKLAHYKALGEDLYLQHCANCHQANGKGLKSVFPPVDVSDYIDQNPERLLCLIEFGVEDEITVNGKMYNKRMPGMPLLTDIEIAQIATYLLNNWGRNQGLVEVNKVTRTLEECE